MKRTPLWSITQVLMIVGGLNWGLVGLFSFDLVAAIFGQLTFLSRIVYILVGLSAVYQLFALGGSGEMAQDKMAKA